MMFFQRLTAIAVLTVLAAGCGAEGLMEFPVAPASGRVVCEGQPVPHVNVYFEPMQTGRDANVGKAGFAVADEAGEFVLSTYNDEDGAVIGKHRVLVEGPRGAEAAGFQCDCVLSDNIDVLEVEIVAGKENRFEVVLKKKSGREVPMSDREREEMEEI